MKNIIFFGPPGAGKGTQARLLSKSLKIAHLSTGDILRLKIETNDKTSQEIKKIIASGKLVTDEILNNIVSERLINEKFNGFILDGYPRTIQQSNFLDNFLDNHNLSIDFIFSIDLNFDNLQKRIVKRSKEENREDDNANIIKVRYQEYLNTTKLVSEKYKAISGKIFNEINGDQEIDQIQSEIVKICKKTWFSLNFLHILTWLNYKKSCIHPHSFFLGHCNG